MIFFLTVFSLSAYGNCKMYPCVYEVINSLQFGSEKKVCIIFILWNLLRLNLPSKLFYLFLKNMHPLFIARCVYICM